MTPKRILGAGILLGAGIAGAWLANATSSGLFGSCAEVTLYYFHPSIRCESCQRLERTAREVLRARFGRELRAGRIAWRPLARDLEENAALVAAYPVATSSALVLVDHRPGRRGRWRELIEAQAHLQAEGGALAEAIERGVREFLDAAEPGSAR